MSVLEVLAGLETRDNFIVLVPLNGIPFEQRRDEARIMETNIIYVDIVYGDDATYK